MATFHKKASPVIESVRIMQHVARIMYRVCVNILVNTGLLSCAWNALYIILAWYCLLVCLCWVRPLLCVRVDDNFRRENTCAGAVPSFDTVLLLVFIARAMGRFLQVFISFSFLIVNLRQKVPILSGLLLTCRISQLIWVLISYFLLCWGWSLWSKIKLSC